MHPIPIPKHIKSLPQFSTLLLQEALNNRGANLTLDGIKGRKTIKALKKLWSRHSPQQDNAELPDYAAAAHKHIGLSEIAGTRSNKTILGWIKHFFPWAKDDGELAWCAIFINTMLEETGHKGTGKANARSFLHWGNKREGKPQVGDIVVFWRDNPNSWKGHVGIYMGEQDGKIACLGGNQRNRVSIALYNQNRVLQYRHI